MEHDVIVWQHPFYWYSQPALLKEWIDQVLAHGWAYGHEGIALRGKQLLISMTTGGPRDAYRREGRNHFTIRELLAPQIQTARLCGMEFVPPFVLFAGQAASDPALAQEAKRYRRALEGLRDSTLRWSDNTEFLNDLEGLQ